MKIAPFILGTIFAFGGVCEQTEVHVGSIKEMDKLIQECQTKPVSKPVTKKVNMKDLYAVSSLVDVYQNTPKDKREIINAIMTYSMEYKINPMTLCALLAKESSLNKDANHRRVFVKVPTKKHWTKIKTAQVKAVGLGGVIYEIWRYELKEIDIHSRDALKDITTNIKAVALILSIYQHERKQLRHTKTKEESALLRYYGVTRDKRGKPHKTYANQVYKIKG